MRDAPAPKPAPSAPPRDGRIAVVAALTGIDTATAARLLRGIGVVEVRGKRATRGGAL
jgi:hypothetical protein